MRIGLASYVCKNRNCRNYAIDNEMALELNSETISQLCKWSKEYGIALLTGYIEKNEECLYSSCVVIENGKIIDRLPFDQEGILIVDIDVGEDRGEDE